MNDNSTTCANYVPATYKYQVVSYLYTGVRTTEGESNIKHVVDILSLEAVKGSKFGRGEGDEGSMEIQCHPLTYMKVYYYEVVSVSI